MKIAQLQRAKEIEKELERIREYYAVFLDEEKAEKYNSVRLNMKRTGTSDYQEYFYGDSGIEGLTEALQFQLEMAKEIIIKKVNAQIKKLQTEFNNL